MSKIEEFVNLIKTKNHTFFHFTDIRNLQSIGEHGILAASQIRNKGIPVITGGNEWSLDADKMKGMDDYVHLCFFNQHPMEHIAKSEGRIDVSKFLKIDPNIILAPGSLISKGVSNKSNAEYGDASKYIEQIDLRIIYTRTDWNDRAIQERLRAAKKYEILIPRHVPIEFIRNI